MTEYVVIYEQSEDGGWGAYFPDLPGVIALGRSREEVEERVQEALRAYADLVREEGRELPTPVHGAGTARI
jgi:predicted RNase H-like HicB family nuclease